jgi:hypothetical protein
VEVLDDRVRIRAKCTEPKQGVTLTGLPVEPDDVAASLHVGDCAPQGDRGLSVGGVAREPVDLPVDDQPLDDLCWWFEATRQGRSETGVTP